MNTDLANNIVGLFLFLWDCFVHFCKLILVGSCYLLLKIVRKCRDFRNGTPRRKASSSRTTFNNYPETVCKNGCGGVVLTEDISTHDCQRFLETFLNKLSLKINEIENSLKYSRAESSEADGIVSFLESKYLAEEDDY